MGSGGWQEVAAESDSLVKGSGGPWEAEADSGGLQKLLGGGGK